MEQEIEKGRKLGIKLAALAIIFGVLETIYFGGNLTPGSRAEFYCDSLSFFLYGGGLALVFFCNHLKQK